MASPMEVFAKAGVVKKKETPEQFEEGNWTPESQKQKQEDKKKKRIKKTENEDVDTAVA